MISKARRWKIVLYVLLGAVVLIFSWIWFVDSVLEKSDARMSAPQDTKWIKVGNHTIAYKHFPANTGKDVLLVGGTTAWSGVWKNTSDDLKDEYNIYAIDLPPFGFSIVDEDYIYNLRNQADLINEFLRKVDANDVVLIAHSYGAGPSMEAVMEEQGTYKKFIIIDGAIHIDKHSTAKVAKKIFNVTSFRYLLTSMALHVPGFIEASLKYLVYDNSTVDDFWVRIYEEPLKVKDQSRRLSNWFYDFVFENGTGLSSDSKNYNNLHVPVTIIWGRQDNLTPLVQGEHLDELIPNSNLVILDDVGHIPMIDNHDLYITVLKEHLP
jgi:pimeloyl-ACP methyl ester carboxylesterase